MSVKNEFIDIGLSRESADRIKSFLEKKDEEDDGETNSTASTYQSYLKMLLERVDDVDYITEIDFRDVAEEEDELSSNSIKTMYHVINNYYEYINHEYNFDYDPPKENMRLGSVINIETKQDSEKDPWTSLSLNTEDIQKIKEEVPSPEFRNQLIIDIAYRTGARKEEIRNLKIDYHRPKKEELLLYSGKSQDDRVATLNQELNYRLKIWVENGYRDGYNYSEKSEYMFPTNRSERISTHQIGNMFRKAADAAGYDDIVYTQADGRDLHYYTFHSIRKGFAQRKNEQGATIQEIKVLMGHSKIKTTQKYLDDSHHEEIRIHNKYG